MADRGALTRRLVIGGGGALLVPGLRAAEDERVAVSLGARQFSVPKPYLFGEVMPPGVSTEGLPPYFSFAFTMPDGAPAGSDLEFPPMSHPFVLEREGGRYLVMCYRVSEARPDSGKALRVPPETALTNMLLATELYVYTTADKMLEFHFENNTGVTQRYLSTYDREEKVGATALVRRINDAMFYYGTAGYEEVGINTIIYVPAERISELRAILIRAGVLIKRWEGR